MNDSIRMQISAFVDGELPDNESELLLRRLSQDAELRQLVSEYYAVGRAMRGQHGVSGMGQLRERIANGIGDKSVQDDFDSIEPTGRRYARPLVGVAIAATVALAAILGLQQLIVGIDATAPAETVAASDSVTLPPVPEQPGNDLLQYRAIHSSSVDNIDARLTPLQLREVALVETDETEVGDGPDVDTQDPQVP